MHCLRSKKSSLIINLKINYKMKKLVYEIHKVDENGKSELVFEGNEKEARNEFDKIESEEYYDYFLSAQWKLNGRNLGTTLIDDK